MKHVMVSSTDREVFGKPFFITYCNTASFTLHLLVHVA